jgi:hypothetical protein
MMDLETCRYIDFPHVGVIDLEAPQLQEKEYEMAAEWRPNEPTIMETIASISRALQEYERAGSFASAVATDARDTVLAAPVTHAEPSVDASVPPRVDEGREVSSPKLVENAKTPAPVPEPSVVDPVVWEEEAPPPGPVATEAERAEARVLHEPAAVTKKSTVPETVAMATTSEIQVAEETGASLS